MWRLGESWCGWVAAVRAGRSWDEFGARICNHCGAWLSLGESNDKPEAVRVEIRAAEIADAMADAAALCDWTLGNEAFVSATAFEERRGWSIAESNMREHSDAWHAGYLAREIATHSEES